MLTEVYIQNYASIYNAKVQLSPFTLLIGANGTGKSNFLKLLREISKTQQLKFKAIGKAFDIKLPAHHSFPDTAQRITLRNDKMSGYSLQRQPPLKEVRYREDIQENAQPKTFDAAQISMLPEMSDVRIFSLNPQNVGKEEILEVSPTVREDGTGTIQVLDSLKTGDREDLFEKIEQVFKDYIPEVKKLSFIPTTNAKRLQIRDINLPNPVLMSELSEGMQLALILITILHQEKKPSLICIEDIDRGLHPRLYQQIVELCFDIAEMEGVQIIATTHNPYLVDEFKDNEEAVVIVEKENGQTKFTTLAERLEQIEPVDEPLGSLWYSGFVGGVPQKA